MKHKKIIPLGMNARNFLYILPYNKPSAKRNADNKLKAKQILLGKKINTPGLIASFVKYEQARNFNWDSLPSSFVLKPSHGYGGSGIVLVKKWSGTQGVTPSGRIITIEDLESLVFEIITGVHSLGGNADSAFIEERIIPMKFFKKIPILGIPDIRVIVFSGVPVMAMMRIPSEKSAGKANLTMGAVGVGVDISTGVTTGGWQKGGTIRLFPGTRVKLRGIKVPLWNDVLEQAVKAQKASKLGFAGIDIILDKHKGPQVIEVNARPGLSIQSVNNASLLERLQRVTNITPKPTVKRGIEIGKSLFTEDFSDRVSKKKDANIIGIHEDIVIHNPQNKKEVSVRAKIDTGAYRTSIDSQIAEELGIEAGDRVLKVKSANGMTERESSEVILTIKGKKIQSLISITDRDHMKYDVIVGRKDLGGFLVDPNKTILHKK